MRRIALALLLGTLGVTGCLNLPGGGDREGGLPPMIDPKLPKEEAPAKGEAQPKRSAATRTQSPAKLPAAAPVEASQVTADNYWEIIDRLERELDRDEQRMSPGGGI